MLGCHGDVVKDSVTSEKPLESAEKASYTYTLQRRNKLRLLKIQYNPNGQVCVCAFLCLRMRLSMCDTRASVR